MVMDQNRHHCEQLSSQRGERVYDWWGTHESLYRQFSPAADRYPAIAQLDLDNGESVLELGCGPGVNFEQLRAAIGPSGQILGIDYSDSMVQQAARQVRNHKWSNVHVVRADATQSCIEAGTFDTAIALLALNTMPSAREAIEATYEALRPGGRFVVLESRELDRWPARLLNPLLRRIWAYMFAYQPTQDVFAELHAVFDTVTYTERSDTAFGKIVLARKTADGSEQ